MARPELEPLTRRLLRDESICIMALFTTKADGGDYYCSLTAPATTIAEALDHGNCYAYAEGPTPDDAVHNARLKLWNGM